MLHECSFRRLVELESANARCKSCISWYEIKGSVTSLFHWSVYTLCDYSYTRWIESTAGCQPAEATQELLDELNKVRLPCRASEITPPSQRPPSHIHPPPIDQRQTQCHILGSHPGCVQLVWNGI